MSKEIQHPDPPPAPAVPRPDPPPFAILSLNPDQIRMLAVWPVVPRDVRDVPDYRAWARMVQLPLARVREIARGLFEMGAALPAGEVGAHFRGYLVSLAKGRLL